MSLVGRACRGATLAAACFTCACASDLFHATDWKTICDEEPSECASSSRASSGPGGFGGQGGTSSVSTSNTGGAGATGGGGSGGGACITCSEAADGGDFSMANFCTGSADLYLLLSDCRCSQCPTACAATTCGTPPQQADLACASCTEMECNAAYTTCLNKVR